MDHKKMTRYWWNILFLSAVALAAVILTVGMLIQNRRYAAEVRSYEERLLLSEGDDKLYSSGEVEGLVLSETAQASRAAREALLTDMEAKLSAGEDMTALLRTLYSDRLVLPAGRGYRFAPRREGVEGHDFARADFTIDAQGRLMFRGSLDPILSQGLRVSSANGVIRWSAVEDTDFVFIRAGYFDNQLEFVTDTAFYQNVSAALSYGLSVYAYVELPATLSGTEATRATEVLRPLLADYAEELEEEILLLLPPEEDGHRPALSAAIVAFATNLATMDRHVILGGSIPALVLDAQPDPLEAVGVKLSEVYLEEPDFADGDALYYPYRFCFWEYAIEENREGIPGTSSRVARFY